MLETSTGLTFTDADAAAAGRAGAGPPGRERRGEQQRELEIALGCRCRRHGRPRLPCRDAALEGQLPAGRRRSDGLLQGWAILENASGQDWRDVAVTLIAGSPRALRQALFASHFVERPEVPVEEPARKDAAGPRRPCWRWPRQPPRAWLPWTWPQRGTARSTTAPAQELTAQTLFPLPQPVTLAAGPHGHGADRRPHAADRAGRPLPRGRRRPAPQRRPAAAQRARGASLPAGLATLYEELPGGGLTFLGDAPLPQLAPDAESCWPTGVDGNIDVAVRSEAQGRIDRARIADGVLELTRVEQQRFAYTVDLRFTGARRAASCWSSRDRTAGASPSRRTPWSRARSLRITRALAAGHAASTSPCVLEQPLVAARRPARHRPASALLLEFAGADTAARAARRRWRGCRNSPARSARLRAGDRAGRDRARTSWPRDQARLRENLAAVPRGQRSCPPLSRRLGCERGRAGRPGRPSEQPARRAGARPRQNGEPSSARCKI